MHAWPMLSMVGLSLAVAGSVRTNGAGTGGVPTGESRAYSVVVPDGDFALHPRPATASESFPFEDGDEDEMATTRSCLTPRWGETKNACAAFSLAPGASVVIELTKVQDTDNNDKAEQIHFRMYDIITQTQVDKFSLEVGKGKHTFTNKSDTLLDLALHAKNDTVMDKRNITFTYEKK